MSVEIQPEDSFFIRKAVVSQQKALEDMQRRAGLNNPGDREALLARPELIEVPLEQLAAGQIFVSVLNGEIVGCSGLMPRTDGETDLGPLLVEPRFQRRGIGRLLVEHCANVARAQGSSILCVVANPHATDFYRALGFQTFETIQMNWSRALLMRKTL